MNTFPTLIGFVIYALADCHLTTRNEFAKPIMATLVCDPLWVYSLQRSQMTGRERNSYANSP